MNILVIGASGRVGTALTEKLLNENHIIVGTTRQEEKLFDSPNYSQINLDLLKEVEEIEKAIPQEIDTIYFVSGSGGKNLLQVDLDGAIKTMKAAEKKSIQRFIMLSSVFSLERDRWEEEGMNDLKDYYLAKHYADQWLVNNTTLNYTILQPGALKETQGSGNITVNVDHHGENSIDNVASTLLAVLEAPSTSKKVITMHDGDTPIKEAIAGV